MPIPAVPSSAQVFVGKDDRITYAWRQFLVDLAASFGLIAFIDLTDVPHDYTGSAGYLVAVTGAEDGLEFIAPGSGGLGTVTSVDIASTTLDVSGGPITTAGSIDVEIPAALLPYADIVTSEAVAAGAIIALHDVGGARARNANAANAPTIPRPAQGFVLSAYASGATARVYFDGIVEGLSGLVPGTVYYLDAAAGLITDTAPVIGNAGVQVVGFGISASAIYFRPLGVTINPSFDIITEGGDALITEGGDHIVTEESP